jgi:Xaa-Pro aminopeptidase
MTVTNTPERTDAAGVSTGTGSTGTGQEAARPLDVGSHDVPVPPALEEFMRAGWAPAESTVGTPVELAPWTAKRRAALADRFPGDHLVVPAGTPHVRANDQYFRFRPSSDYLWLTGDATPGAVLVIGPGDGGSRATLFAAQTPEPGSSAYWRDRSSGPLWNGPRPSLRELSEVLGVECRPLDELAGALRGVQSVRALRGHDAYVDAQLPSAPTPHADRELAAELAQLRLVKDAWEMEQLQLAVDATTRGFEDVVRALPAAVAGGGERLLEGVFWQRARIEGNDVGYASIVGAGSHSTVLHWTENSGAVVPGELLLLDAGVETRTFYTADITRILPISGQFSDVQREVYDLVLAANDAGVAAIRPGARFRDFHWAAMEVLARGLHGMGLLPGSVDEALDPQSQLYRRWTLCGSGHMLGLDVHDCAAARAGDYVDGELAEGQVLTVEPGAYFQPNDLLVPPALRGIGMRIEEDLVVTADGAQILSSALPRAAADVEAWMARVAGA